jgi:hypothetical protein
MKLLVLETLPHPYGKQFFTNIPVLHPAACNY